MKYEDKRFCVRARRRFKKEQWTEWTRVDNYDDAVKQAKKAEAAGYEAKIVDKGVRSNDVNDR